MNHRRHASEDHRPWKPRRGFTLTEMLVTVSIIIVLSLLAYGMATRLINGSRIAQSSSNLRTLALANATYESDNGQYCPSEDQYNITRWHGKRSSSATAFDPKKGLLSPYLGASEQVGVCPLFRGMAKSAASFEEGTGGYGYNTSYIGGRPGPLWDNKTKLMVPAKRSMVEDPTRTVMFTTTGYAREDGVQEYASCEPPYWDFGSGPSGQRPSPTVSFRANGKALVAWCDGHVTAEARNKAAPGENPHGGDATGQDLGWFGPEENNGYWNTRKE